MRRRAVGEPDRAAAPDGGDAVHVRGLVKSYGGVRAVQGVDLDIRRGEIFALLGPNGAGKTSTPFRWTDVGVVALWGVAGVVLAMRWFRWEPRTG